MNQAESLYDVLKRVIGRNDGVGELQWSDCGEGDKILEYDLLGDIPIDDSQWMLKDATESESEMILTDFVGTKTPCGWSLSCQMARLLSEKGYLVARKMDRILEKTDWQSCGELQLLLSYLAVRPDGAEWAKKLLDVVPNDARDGLFLACWKIQDRELHSKLLGKFEEWITADETWGCGDGEDGWLGKFISKWLTEGTFTYAQLEKCIRWHFKHMYPQPTNH